MLAVLSLSPLWLVAIDSASTNDPDRIERDGQRFFTYPTSSQSLHRFRMVRRASGSQGHGPVHRGKCLLVARISYQVPATLFDRRAEPDAVRQEPHNGRYHASA